MSHNQSKLLTIGQFAALHQVNKKTLMWYDEVGLFKPAIVRENGYRYYTCQQCSVFETILMLRELNVSIPDIKTYLSNRSAASFQTVLSEKTIEIHNAIQHLQQIKKALLHQTKALEDLNHIDLSEYSILECPAQKLILLKTTKELSLEQEAEMIFGEVHHHQAYRMYGILYGSLLPVSSLYQRDFTNYYGVFLQVPEVESSVNAYIRPAGTYLRTYFKGSWDKLPQKYTEILEYASKNKLELQGYAYETGINEFTSNSMDDYITKIEIPIRKIF